MLLREYWIRDILGRKREENTWYFYTLPAHTVNNRHGALHLHREESIAYWLILLWCRKKQFGSAELRNTKNRHLSAFVPLVCYDGRGGERRQNTASNCRLIQKPRKRCRRFTERTGGACSLLASLLSHFPSLRMLGHRLQVRRKGLRCQGMYVSMPFINSLFFLNWIFQRVLKSLNFYLFLCCFHSIAIRNAELVNFYPFFLFFGLTSENPWFKSCHFICLFIFLQWIWLERKEKKSIHYFGSFGLVQFFFVIYFHLVLMWSEQVKWANCQAYFGNGHFCFSVCTSWHLLLCQGFQGYYLLIVW